MRKVWFEKAWEDYTAWQREDKKILKRINELVQDIERSGGFKGIGKPEPLKGSLSGLWSRRIDETHRLVYRISGENGEILEIHSCKNHY